MATKDFDAAKLMKVGDAMVHEDSVHTDSKGKRDSDSDCDEYGDCHSRSSGNDEHDRDDGSSDSDGDDESDDECAKENKRIPTKLAACPDLGEKLAFMRTHLISVKDVCRPNILFAQFYKFLRSEESVRTVGMAFREVFGEYVLCHSRSKFQTLIDDLEAPDWKDVTKGEFPTDLDVVGILLDVGLKRASSGSTWPLFRLSNCHIDYRWKMKEHHEETAPQTREQEAIIDRAKAQFDAESRAAEKRYLETLQTAVAIATKRQEEALEKANKLHQAALETSVKQHQVTLEKATTRVQEQLREIEALKKVVGEALTKARKEADERAHDSEKRAHESEKRAWKAEERARKAEVRARKADEAAWSMFEVESEDAVVELCLLCAGGPANAHAEPCDHEMCLTCADKVRNTLCPFCRGSITHVSVANQTP